MANEPDTIYEKALNRNEKEEVTATLEHLVAVGAYWEHRADCCDQASEEASNRNNNYNVKIHVEDQCMYVNPERKRRGSAIVATGPNRWDLQYGDTIHPIAFMDAKLSKKRRRTTKEDATMNGPNIAIDTTKSSVSKKEVPRALLIHCWQRAVHAASNPIVIDDDEKLPARNSNKTPQTDFSPERARAKCEAMGITLPIRPKDAPHNTMCPSCEVAAFDTDEQQLERHYYGMPNQRGCCWILIDQRHHELVDQVLQEEIKLVVQQLGKSIQTYAKISKKADGGEEETLDWKAVVAALQRASTSGVLPPPSLNASLVEVIKGRLDERYADIPR
mmetsp:Transcript_11012/g.18259  ORF Transcript_11012/g.18259 Transcript_11012/m.18259 type:complete len:332 (+) Transcript_11012:174-1169(+)|eukprot:CAMPEP_0119005692 /NCGR_PEP_ID=MMETSP1176-20130426/1870_1 /TAXON_ID=265551 /ORGANISM="Synedropsis recta cf, Strain CCMP1620" /LENGTH=331 /DNA_ID=CAMNT_0006957529 /DNA_START=156 /DNA_END=1151 /DNA_ORIENTATION=+